MAYPPRKHTVSGMFFSSLNNFPATTPYYIQKIAMLVPLIVNPYWGI